ncbi:related to SEN1 protein [Cephalotrichum gorgonifer]|uniref:Related to SEN1 protein n=2 Tax=Hypocreomycetidae TaxID=222543 RepID=A0AAE8MW04_9PEZI|nr:related to SEN1 protein [Cephalotrichum gorgonifer]
MEARPIEEVISHWFTKLRAIPKDVHLLCPKTGPDDEEDYTTVAETDDVKQKRIQDGKDRVQIAYWCTLVFGMPKGKLEDQSKELSDRLGHWLKECDQCIMNWHMCRKSFLQEFAETYNESAVEELQRMYRSFDFARLDSGLQWAREVIESEENEGRVFKYTSERLGPQRVQFLLTIFESLCTMEYLSLPDKRQAFQFAFSKVNVKKPLKLPPGQLLPAMTTFLFNEEPTRLRFGQGCWERFPRGAMTPAQFDWAVNDHLSAAITSVAAYDPADPSSYPHIQRFWEGFHLILQTLNEDLIVHKLRAMEVKPSPYELLFHHMACNSEGILVSIIKVFSGLLEKAPTAFWDAIGDPKPFTVAEQLFYAPQFRSLVSQSAAIGLEQEDSSKPPLTVSWIYAWMKSVKKNEKSDACQSLLHMLFDKFIPDPYISDEGRAACALAAFDALTDFFDSFLTLANARGQFPNILNSTFVSPNNILHLNTALNMTHQFKTQIVEWAEKRQQAFDAQKAAMRVVRTALELDSRATAEECKAIQLGKPYQTVVVRNSASLWDGFLDLLYPGNLEQAKHVLHGMFPLLAVERFRPARRAEAPMADAKIKFNANFDKLAGVVGTVLQRLCQFDRSELDDLTRDGMKVLLSFTFHAADSIRESAIELLKTITGEASRSDAIIKLVQQQPSGTMRIFNFAINQTVKCPTLEEGSSLTKPATSEARATPPYGPVLHILSISQDVLSALCDPSTGLLRKKTLTHPELDAVYSWWCIQWLWIDAVFKYTEPWSKYIEIPVMTELCRQMIELGEGLVAEDGLLASALKEDAMKNTLGDRPDEAKAQSDVMRKVLSPCSKHLHGFVKMLRLRDEYLVSIATKIVCKLLIRLREAELEIGDLSRNYIHDACRLTQGRKYRIATNLTRQQKAELLVALDGDDADEIEFVGERKVGEQIPGETTNTKRPIKRQSTIDAWSKSGVALRTNRDDVLELSPTVDSTAAKSALDQIAARLNKAAAKTPPAPKTLKPLTAKLPPGGFDAARTKALIESRKKEKLDKQRRDAETIAKAKALRESAQTRSEIMVESSEEESDESDGDDDLAAFMDQQETGQKLDQAMADRQALARRKALGPIKKRKANLNEKDMRARISPNMGPLHHAVLEWDIFHEGNDPPNVASVNKVSNTYAGEAAYRNTFHPLLLHEAWRSFVTDMGECINKPFGMKVATRMTVDGFLQVTSTMPGSEARGPERPAREGDIVIVSMSEDPRKDRNAPHCLARIHSTRFKRDSFEVEYRVSPKSREIAQELMPGKVLHVLKITNMVTVEREYATLLGLMHYDLLDEVLNAKPSPILKYSERAIEECRAVYGLNPAQATAVLGAKDNDGFTLIQGPPGTGKTKTIIAMVGALLNKVVTTSAPGQPRPAGGSLKKLLVCAPSNAAVDELVLRLKQGSKSLSGNHQKINVIRLGRGEVVNAAVTDVTLEELVNRRMLDEKVQDNAKTEIEKIHAEAKQIKEKVDDLWVKVTVARDSGDRDGMGRFQRELDHWKRLQTQTGAKIDEIKSSGKTVAREIDLKRLQFQKEILASAHVLCTTLSGSGHDLFKKLNDVDFETVIIDEAAQCVELSALIPLKYGAVKCILVGDPKQLPPTVLSQSAARYGYDQSLFVRMQQCHPGDVHLLDTQYRMHPLISMFPSREFYEGRLFDGSGMADIRKQPWHASTVFGPYRFFDVMGTQTKGNRGQSLVNMPEVNVAVQLYDRLRTDYRMCDFKRKIGIITPYKAQLSRLREVFASRYGPDIGESIEFNTTDAFQGRECEIIIFSCVRATPKGGIGFMTDIRRMNVGLTRAKSSLWILGDSRALVQGQFWAKLIEDARARKLYTNGDILSMLRRPTEKAAQNDGYCAAPSILANPPQASGSPPQEVVLHGSRQSPSTAVDVDQGPRQFSGAVPDSDMRKRISYIDGKGEAVPDQGRPVGRPIIHATSVEQPVKKRQHEGPDGSDHAAKRIASTGANSNNTRGDNGGKPLNSGNQRAGNHQVRRLPKALQPISSHKRPSAPSRPTPAAVDPAAMDALGLRPPPRAPPPAQAYSGQGQHPPHPPQGAQGQGQGPPHAGPNSGPPPGAPTRVLAVDLLNPAPASEARKHKLKTLVPAPRSFFMDVKCPGCFTITTVFSHAQTVVICQGCTTVLCQPTGGKARLTEGCSFRRK